MKTEKVPVLIVGAGPSGLVLGLWLEKMGIPFRIIDKSTEPGTTSRALAIQARTLEYYRQLGIDSQILEAGLPVPELVIRRKGKVAAQVHLGDMGQSISPFPYLLFLAQDEHERILNKNLKTKVEWRTEFTQMTQHQDFVEVCVKRGTETEVIRADYVCGCDGAHSAVRHQLGIDFQGGTYNRVFFVADVEAVGAIAEKGVQVSVSPEDFCIVMPIHKTKSVRLTGVIPHDKEKKEHFSFDDVAESVRVNTGLNVSRVNWFSSYHVHHRVASHFQLGRVFLLGDAGHIHSPAGGQGMNTGIGDAVNLAWKLASVINKKSSEKILETYEIERIVFAQTLIASTDTAFRFISSDSWFGSLWRAYLMPKVFSLIARVKPFLKMAFRILSQTRIHYRESDLSSGKINRKLHAGDRLPWLRIAGSDNYDCLKTCNWQIHVYGEVTEQLKKAAEARHIPVHAFNFNRYAKGRGFMKDALYLIRPDGHIALENRVQDPLALTRYLDQWQLTF